MENSEVRDLKKVNEEKNAKITAFFDLDGTLLPLPSLERRFFLTLRRRGEIPLRNYFAWLREAIRLLPHGTRAVKQTNKMYLKGVKSLNESDAEDRNEFSAHASGHRAEGQASAPSLKSASGRMRNNPRSPVPRFFEEALERVAQHAKLGHAIVLVSGTLEPLANAVAPHLHAELANRGLNVKIHVCATRLEEIGGRWTGRILGESMFGEGKVRAVKKLAEEWNLDLSHCFAYADSAADQPMLASVGNPLAANPSRKLAHTAKKHGWLVLNWQKEEKSTRRMRSLRTAPKRPSKVPLLQSGKTRSMEPCT
ncbi:MAG TPA: HAD-IB family phosphatase [Candidatus Acidoferrum sp.]|nr:HAD-IB family phosphatase [Candidatus Acidoferrum sp.]